MANDTITAASGQFWNGSYLTGGKGPTPTGVVVAYKGPTNTQPGRWVARLRLDGRSITRAVGYQAGPLAAVEALLAANDWSHWRILSAAYVDADTYAVAVQPPLF